MNRYPVDYPYINSIGYEIYDNTLEIEFDEGSIYQYFNVPEELYWKFREVDKDFDIDTIPVKSSLISEIGYDAHMEIALIELNSGEVFLYLGIKEEIFEDFTNASSLGTFLNRTLKYAGYKHRKVGEAIEEESANRHKIPLEVYSYKALQDKTAKQPSPNRRPILYSYVTSVGYDRENETMEIEFSDGAVYQYYHVPEEYCERLINTDSDGNDVFRELVESSEIRSIGYDTQLQILHVGFINKSVYLYFGISEDIYKHFLEANCHYSFLNETVKWAGFRYYKVNSRSVIDTDKVSVNPLIESSEDNSNLDDTLIRIRAMSAMANMMYEEAFYILCNINHKSHKAYSMLINIALITFRYEEANAYLKEYSQLISDYGHYSPEFKEEYQTLLSAVRALGIDELNLTNYAKGNYQQSKIKHAIYPESKPFIESCKAGTIKEMIEINELNLYSNSPETRANANFFIAECYFRLKKYDEAYSYYLAASKNIPTKALFYGYAAQSLLRHCKNKIEETYISEIPPLLKSKFTEIFIILRRAIALDADNPSWHRLFMMFIMIYYRTNKLENTEIGNIIKRQAKNEYDTTRELLKKHPNFDEQKALDELSTLYNFQ